MKLTDFIKSLVDVLNETGECEVYITTKTETKMYDAALLHFIPENKYLDRPILRVEGVNDNDEE